MQDVGGGVAMFCDFHCATQFAKAFYAYNLFPCFTNLNFIKVLLFRDYFLGTFLAKAETNR